MCVSVNSIQGIFSPFPLNYCPLLPIKTSKNGNNTPFPLHTLISQQKEIYTPFEAFYEDSSRVEKS